MSYTPRFRVRASLSSHPATTLSTAHMRTLWRAMLSEGKIRWLFYDGETKTEEDYLAFMTESAVYAYGVYDTHDTPLATYFVNNFMGNACMMHFCYLNAGLTHHHAIGIDTCHFLLRNSGISALIGITPRPFRHAWKFALTVGFVQKAIIPGACKLLVDGRSKYVDAVATLCTRETLKPLEQ